MIMENFKINGEWKPVTENVFRDWEDERLPQRVETFSFECNFTGYKRDNEHGPRYAVLAGIDFSVDLEKLDLVDAKPGDIIRVERLVTDPAYRGDGIVKIVNKSKGNKSATIKDWEIARTKERERWKAEGQQRLRKD
jgi:hypothetical protein